MTNWLDVEANFAPYESIETNHHASDVSTRVSGVSDLFLRAKVSLWGNDGRQH